MKVGIETRMIREPSRTGKGMKGRICIVFFGLLLALKPAVGQDLTLSCKGVETFTMITYSEDGKFQNANERKKEINYTLSIEDSFHEGYGCRFTDKKIWCDSCAKSSDSANCKKESLNYTSVDRYTGQTTVMRLIRLKDKNLGVMNQFEGVCSKVERRKF
jgi:hypothetical protein